MRPCLCKRPAISPGCLVKLLQYPLGMELVFMSFTVQLILSVPQKHRNPRLSILDVRYGGYKYACRSEVTCLLEIK
jgi:hypothetical protein